MHPSLEPSKIRFLPGRVKLCARALVDGVGTQADLDHVLLYIDQASATEAEIQCTLPIFYALLHSRHIPAAPTSENIAVLDGTTMALGYVALATLATPNVPLSAEVAKDLWTGVWDWMVFISTFASAIPGLARYTGLETSIFLMILTITAKFHRVYDLYDDLLPGCKSPEGVYMITRAWALGPRASTELTDIQDMEFVQTFLAKSRFHLNPHLLPSLYEAAQGPGGLAALVLDTLGYFVRDLRVQPDEFAIVRENAALLQLIGNIDPTVSAHRSTQLSDGSPGFNTLSPFGRALISEGALELLSKAAEFYFEVENGWGLAYHAMSVLACLLVFPEAHQRARLGRPGPGTIGKSLVRAVMGLVMTLPQSNELAPERAVPVSALAEFYFTRILPAMAGESSFVQDVRFLLGFEPRGPVIFNYPEPEHPRARSRLRTRRAWEEIFQSWCVEHPGVWEPFLALVTRHTMVMDFSAASRKPEKWCDHSQCPHTENRPQLKRCSGCSTIMYCSVACQYADWANGHRKVCFAYKLLRKYNSQLGLTKAQQHFLESSVCYIGANPTPSTASFESILHYNHWNASGSRKPTIVPIRTSDEEFSENLFGALRCPNPPPSGVELAWRDMIRRAQASRGFLTLVVVHFARGVPGCGGREECYLVLLSSLSLGGCSRHARRRVVGNAQADPRNSPTESSDADGPYPFRVSVSAGLPVALTALTWSCLHICGFQCGLWGYPVTLDAPFAEGTARAIFSDPPPAV
uniref:MYND-type domain-containing protein n=1 Tax=Mycena chlorophos TaxID=658473 RepID=A0ABQ0LX43_MYCCL|nr:predicted protein [Mycena chlorophos]